MTRPNLNPIGRNELQPGDHIYTYRLIRTYSHHVIYVGDENVIHFGVNSSNKNCYSCYQAQLKYQKKKPERALVGHVIISCLDCFLEGGKIYRYNYSVEFHLFLILPGSTATLDPSKDEEEVLERAVYLLNHGFGTYNPITKNCEQFALYCKTGKKNISNQAVFMIPNVFNAAKYTANWASLFFERN